MKAGADEDAEFIFETIGDIARFEVVDADAENADAVFNALRA